MIWTAFFGQCMKMSVLKGKFRRRRHYNNAEMDGRIKAFLAQPITIPLSQFMETGFPNKNEFALALCPFVSKLVYLRTQQHHYIIYDELTHELCAT